MEVRRMWGIKFIKRLLYVLFAIKSSRLIEIKKRVIL